MAILYKGFAENMLVVNIDELQNMILRIFIFINGLLSHLVQSIKTILMKEFSETAIITDFSILTVLFDLLLILP